MMETIRAHQIKEGVGGRKRGREGWRGVWDVSCTSPRRTSPSPLPPHTAAAAAGGEAAIINAEGLLAAMCAPRH